MARHQIIYTSCMRGIDGVNDGQQIFSYDEAFKDGKADEVKSLFTYQVPALPAGTLMSEEIALTMPVAFSYRLLKNGLIASPGVFALPKSLHSCPTRWAACFH